MAVLTTNRTTPHTGDGATTVFAYTFRVIEAGHLKVTLDGQPSNIGFSVSNVGDNSGGNVTFDSPPANGVAILFYREVPLDQQTLYGAYSAFPAQVVEDDFDKRTMVEQQLSDAQLQALRVPVNEVVAQFPAAADRKGKVAAFSSVDGDAIAADFNVGFIQSDTKYFDTIALAKQDATLQVGNYVQTTGYHNAFDGGHGLYRVVAAGTGTDDGGRFHDSSPAGAFQLQLVIDGTLNVRQWGARGDNTNDDTAAINAAANAYRQIVVDGAFIGNAGFTNPHFEHGVELFFPYGIYLCNGTLWLGANISGGEDYRHSVKNIRFGIGAVVNCKATGLPAMDFSGGYGARWQNVCVFGDGTDTPNVGLLMARSGTASPNQSAGAHHFINCKFIGNYTVASVYNYASEVNTWISPEIRNSKAASFASFYITGDNGNRAITSAFTTVQTATYQSTYAPRILGGQIRYDVEGTGSNALMILESPSFGPKVNTVYLDLLQGATTSPPIVRLNKATVGSASQLRVQGVTFIACVVETEFDSLFYIDSDTRELFAYGNSFAEASKTADIVLAANSSLRAPSIQAYRGASSLETMTYSIDATATFDSAQLTFIPKVNTAGYDFIETALTRDGTWQTLDISSIVPKATRIVAVKVEANNSGSISNTDQVSLREPNNTNIGSDFTLTPNVTNIFEVDEGLVPVIDQQIQYKASANYDRLRILIRGWYV